MRLEDIRTVVRTRLGYPGVNVELDNTAIDQAVTDSLALFNNYLCNPEPRVVKNRQGSVVIPLIAGDNGVLAVKTFYPDDLRAYYNMSVFELMYRMVFPNFPVSDWYLLKSFYKMYQRVRGVDPDWWYDEGARVLYVDCNGGPFDIFYLVSTDLTLETIDTVKSTYIQDFKNYVLANCKLVLAKVRGNFGGTIPVPGGSLSTDSAQLEAEAEKDMEKIEMKLNTRAQVHNSPVQWV